MAATGIFFLGQTAPPVTPTVSTGNWTSQPAGVASGSCLISDFSKTFDAAQTTNTVALANGSASDSTLVWKFVSPCLAAQTISGNLRGQFRCNISGTTGSTAITKMVVTVLD